MRNQIVLFSMTVTFLTGAAQVSVVQPAVASEGDEGAATRLGTPGLPGGHTSLADPAAERDGPRLPDPTWKRLGLSESPTLESGRGVGVVMIDDAGLHSALLHLGDRLKHVIVDEEMNVTLVEPLRDYKPRDEGGRATAATAYRRCCRWPPPLFACTTGAISDWLRVRRTSWCHTTAETSSGWTAPSSGSWRTGGDGISASS